MNIDKIILNFMGKAKVPALPINAMLKEKNKVGEQILCDFKTYYKVTTAIKTDSYW